VIHRSIESEQSFKFESVTEKLNVHDGMLF
jgi:hypothetical protein